MSFDSVLVYAFQHALQAALALTLSHGIAVAIAMYFDMSGKWDSYALHKNRSPNRLQNYWTGWRSFSVDVMTLFIPCMTAFIYYRADKITNSTDTLIHSLIKLSAGYFLGKVWAFVIHYFLHTPMLYRFHKRHHRNPAKLVASASWDDSFVEYFVMEIPSFALTVVLFPTHWWVHLAHFCLHGMDGACGHSGFAGAPGILGYMFDGEYHYYHHAYLTVNYAELEVIDKMFGTHHSQQERFAKKQVPSKEHYS
jgi:hypothetical protein